MTLYGCCCCCWLLLVWAGVVSCCWVGMSSPTEGSHSTPSYRLISILAPPHHHSDQTGPASTTHNTNNTCWSSQHQLLLLTWGPRVVCGGLSVQCYEAALLRPRLDTGLSRPAHHNQDIIWLPGHHLTWGLEEEEYARKVPRIWKYRWPFPLMVLLKRLKVLLSEQKGRDFPCISVMSFLKNTSQAKVFQWC